MWLDHGEVPGEHIDRFAVGIEEIVSAKKVKNARDLTAAGGGSVEPRRWRAVTTLVHLTGITARATLNEADRAAGLAACCRKLLDGKGLAACADTGELTLCDRCFRNPMVWSGGCLGGTLAGGCDTISGRATDERQRSSAR